MLFGHRSYRNDQNAPHHPPLLICNCLTCYLMELELDEKAVTLS